MPTFPLPEIPAISWHKGAGDAAFGSTRPKDPRMGIHGACDLAADPGTPVFAILSGTIIKGPYKFVEYVDGKTHCHSLTWAIEVKHDGFIGRYCEIGHDLPSRLGTGSEVTEGDVIAYVGHQCGMSMLHFEMFKHTTDKESLNENKIGKYLYVPKADYRRREDLLDPTAYLDQWAAELTRMKREKVRTMDDTDYNSPGSRPFTMAR